MGVGGFKWVFLLLSILAVSASGRAAQWYIRGAVGYDWSLDADFHDVDPSSTDPPALFGQGAGSDGRDLGAYGDFGGFPVFEVAAGVQPMGWLRTDVSLAYRAGIEYTGQANFLHVPGQQPVTADAESWAGMVNMFIEIAGLVGFDPGIFTPYVGGGVGLSHNRIGEMTYRFPGLARHKLSITPSGSRTDFAYMVAIGTGIRLSNTTILDISYRYSDLAPMQTDSGNMYMDFLPAGIDIDETSAPFRTHGVLVGLRYLF